MTWGQAPGRVPKRHGGPVWSGFAETAMALADAADRER
jgi:hypothetical protein